MVLEQQGNGLSNVPLSPPLHILISTYVGDKETLDAQISPWSKRSSENYSSSNPFRVDVKLTLVIRGSETVNATNIGGIPNLMQHLRCAKLAKIAGIGCFDTACEHQYCFSVQSYGHKKR